MGFFESEKMSELPQKINKETQLILSKINNASVALSEAKNLDEILHIKNTAEAMRYCLAQAAASLAVKNEAGVLRLKAERKAGEMLAKMEKNKGRPLKKGTHGGTVFLGAVKKLEDIGITKKQSSRWQQEASVPKTDFEEYLQKCKENREEITSAGLYRIAQKKKAEIIVTDLKEEKVELPKGKYHTIVIDPPWEMKKIEREVRPNQMGLDYPTMNYDELSEFEIPAHDNCHLYVWTTQKHLPATFELLQEWGFKYLVTMVWHKPGGPQPFGLPQYNCEFVLLCRKGNLPFLETKAFNCCFNAARREHSRKPDEFYDLVQRVSPGPRIDIFSREKRKGFKSWGNETGKF